jgi:protein-S-isoprenylcysteine O-methyltransferase Ste14
VIDDVQASLMVFDMNDRIKILLLMIFYVPIVSLIIAWVIITPSGDNTWLDGWLFVFLILAYIWLFMLYALIKDPELLMKRAKYVTDDPNTQSFPDKTFMVFAMVLMLFCVIFPGLDYNFEISPLPGFFKLLGFIGIILSMAEMMYVNKVNRYASKGLVIHKDHELITSGPYQYVRHPLYTGASIFFVCIPLALGSLIASVISLLFPLLLVYRVRIEEKMLVEHLPGYKDYMNRVKYRLIPKIY